MENKERDIISERVFRDEGMRIIEEMAKLEIDISILERQDPNAVIARRNRKGKNGATESVIITAQEMLAKYRNDMEGHNERLKAVTKLQVERFNKLNKDSKSKD
jgi:hypothetical protein